MIINAHVEHPGDIEEANPMSHPEQFGFFSAVEQRNRCLIDHGRILEIGSYDVNGSIRSLFRSAAEYVGVDLQEGPGVDIVSYGHELDHPNEYFDVTVSGECFEHDPHWRKTFLNMCRMTRPGGTVAFTCASRGRPEHGTTRSDHKDSPGTQSRGLNYYRNLSAEDFEQSIRISELFDDYRFWYMPTSFDLYFAGIRTGEVVAGPAGPPLGQLPDQAEVAKLSSLMPIHHRIVRMPLRVAMRVTSEDRYQSLALPYWRTLLRAQDTFGSGRFRRAASSQVDFSPEPKRH